MSKRPHVVEGRVTPIKSPRHSGGERSLLESVSLLPNSFENLSSDEDEILLPSECDVESLPASASSLRNLVPTEEPFQSTQSSTRSFGDE